jgi:hypothetical protein
MQRQLLLEDVRVTERAQSVTAGAGWRVVIQFECSFSERHWTDDERKQDTRKYNSQCPRVRRHLHPP